MTDENVVPLKFVAGTLPSPSSDPNIIESDGVNIYFGSGPARVGMPAEDLVSLVHQMMRWGRLLIEAKKLPRGHPRKKEMLEEALGYSYDMGVVAVELVNTIDSAGAGR